MREVCERLVDPLEMAMLDSSSLEEEDMSSVW
jgi:hypothetical protein